MSDPITQDELAELKLLAKQAKHEYILDDFLDWMPVFAAYLVAAANAVPRLLDEISGLQSEINVLREIMNPDQVVTEKALIQQEEELARLRARIVELEDGIGIMDNTIQELEGHDEQ
jgi:hypothetical protein